MTIKDETLIQVRNLMDHLVVYKDENTNTRRRFEKGSVIKIPAGEIRRMMYQKGTRILFHDYLCIENKELAAEFGITEDMVEYWWTEQDVDRVLTTGSMDELLDALDFAPDGIKEMIRRRAIELRISDMNKRTAIEKAFGFSVTKAIELAAEDDDNEVVEEQPRARRVRKDVELPTSGRRAKQ
jgi:hypothetical protein